MPEHSRFYSHGKLLLTGEYAVIDGALSLALPTKFGQSLTVQSQPDKEVLLWRSFNHKKELWFEATLTISNTEPQFTIVDTNDPDTATTLETILLAALGLNPDFKTILRGSEVTTLLEFPRDWGLGSSSTFINNVAQWAKVDAFELLWKGFTGSGYDIACAQNATPILYKVSDFVTTVSELDFTPNFKDELFFVHLNKKQNSREGIKNYKKRVIDKVSLIKEVTQLTHAIADASDIETFNDLLFAHEQIISEALGMQPVKKALFSDFTGAVKSLGAWGGDFVLATGGKNNVLSYFKAKGYDTILSYSEMIL